MTAVAYDIIVRASGTSSASGMPCLPEEEGACVSTRGTIVPVGSVTPVGTARAFPPGSSLRQADRNGANEQRDGDEHTASTNGTGWGFQCGSRGESRVASDNTKSPERCQC